MAFPESSASEIVKSMEPPYEGAPGRTRLQTIHFPEPGGRVRSVQVYRVVNVATDPHLRELALTGALHRFEQGEELAIPFVFHDPGRRKLALVVPEALRHRELALRAELLTEIAEATDAPVPAYVRDATTVVGFAALRELLDRADAAPVAASTAAELAERAEQEASLTQRELLVTNREAALLSHETLIAAREGALGQREAALLAREAQVSQREGQLARQEAQAAQSTRDLEARAEALAQREARLHARAEQVTSREDELRSTGEELEAAQADLAMREQELESRLEALRERERAHRAEPASASVTLPAPEVEDVEELEELEPIATSPGRVPEDLASAVEMLTEAPPPADLGQEVEEIVDDVEALEEVQGEITGVHAERSDLHPVSTVLTSIDKPKTEPPPAPKAEPAGPRPSVPPPAEFGDRKREVVVSVEQGTLRLFARLPEGRDDALASPPDLLVQLVVVDEVPTVLLTLVESGEGRPLVLRAGLDPRSKADRQALDTLRREYRARLAIFTSGARYLRTIEIDAPREANVARVLDRASKLKGAAIDGATAIGRALSTPPPYRADHPFDAAEEASTAKDAVDAIARLSEWTSAERLDHAQLVLSVPRERIDAAIARVLGDALRFGLALPPGLGERAIALGVAPDPASLILEQIRAFAQTSRLPDRGGLGDEAVASNWESLLKSAAADEVAIETETHELAWNAIHKARGGDGDPGRDVDASKLAKMGPPELVLLLEHPRHRKLAAIELANRKDAALAETICKAVRKMPRAEVVRVVPRLVSLGDEVGDALVDGLSARKTFVRQAFALALGKLELRRAVVPLLHLLQSEESQVWREIARVLGSFGNASLRNVARQLKEPKGQEERLILTLAHLCNHGCQKQVDKMTREEKPSIATMAAEALTLAKDAGITERQVLGKLALASDDPILKFSRRFYEELEGKAPEQDLEDGTET